LRISRLCDFFKDSRRRGYDMSTFQTPSETGNVQSRTELSVGEVLARIWRINRVKANKDFFIIGKYTFRRFKCFVSATTDLDKSVILYLYTSPPGDLCRARRTISAADIRFSRERNGSLFDIFYGRRHIWHTLGTYLLFIYCYYYFFFFFPRQNIMFSHRSLYSDVVVGYTICAYVHG